MSSWVLEYTSQESNNSREDGDEWFDLLQAGCDPTASNLSLPIDAFLRAAISLKDQVFMPLHSLCVQISVLLVLFS